MSTTETKRSLHDAIVDAEAFRALFPGCYERWEVAGSVRRRRPAVGDIEHVVIPKWGDVVVANNFLFTRTEYRNLLWTRLDQLVAAGTLTQHLYGDAQQTRYGNRLRGVDFRGFNNEIFSADADNWGSVLAIRTGPAEFQPATGRRTAASPDAQRQGVRVAMHGMRVLSGASWSEVRTVRWVRHGVERKDLSTD